jgi:hypothetical protein
MSANPARASTLNVHCGGKVGLTSIGAALKTLQFPGSGPSTINISGACNENVVIQSLDRLTLNAAPGASITDASHGTLDVILISDSRDVAINGFTINAGSGVDVNGVVCGDFSTCRLRHNVIQGAGSGGFTIFGQSQATLDGDILQNNGVGLFVRSGSRVRNGVGGQPFISRSNGQGISIGRQGFAFIQATVENNSDRGVDVLFQSTLELTGSITGNGSVGANVREGSIARFTTATITGNAGPGVLVHDLSMASFNEATVTENGGGTDVDCEPQFPVTRGTADIGGTTNCVE